MRTMSKLSSAVSCNVVRLHDVQSIETPQANVMLRSCMRAPYVVVSSLPAPSFIK